jgi:hypothetical protein
MQECLRRINELYRMTAPRYRVNNSYWYCFELVHQPAHWPKLGANAISVRCLHRDERLSASVQLQVRDVELDCSTYQAEHGIEGKIQRSAPRSLQTLGPSCKVPER